MLMEFMGLHLPGASFVNPNTPLRDELTKFGAKRALAISSLGNEFTPVAKVLDEKAFVNGMVGMNATGGSTNLLIHLLAMAKSCGITITCDDIAEISSVVPLMARVYPNGLADVNHFHAAGGLGYMIGELLQGGLLHDDVSTVNGDGMEHYTSEPKLIDGELTWEAGAKASLNEKIVRPVSNPFQPRGGLKTLTGSLGTAVMKISAVKEERHIVEAPVAVFEDQYEVKKALVRVDATNGVLDILTEGVMERVIAPKDLSASQFGTGREMFEVFRQNVGPASTGASAI